MKITKKDKQIFAMFGIIIIALTLFAVITSASPKLEGKTYDSTLTELVWSNVVCYDDDCEFTMNLTILRKLTDEYLHQFPNAPKPEPYTLTMNFHTINSKVSSDKDGHLIKIAKNESDLTAWRDLIIEDYMDRWDYTPKDKSGGIIKVIGGVFDFIKKIFK